MTDRAESSSTTALVGPVDPVAMALDQQLSEIVEYVFMLERQHRFEDRLDSMLGLLVVDRERHACHPPPESNEWMWSCPSCSLKWSRQLSGGWLPKTE